MAFASALPLSLEELYLEINGEGLTVDEDEDFDPMQQLAPDIFKALPRLHTTDIHAWISNLDGGLGHYPEKAVFYRRLPSGETGKKEIWITRMDTPYQENDMELVQTKEVCEGVFEGRDASDTWTEVLPQMDFNNLTGPWKGEPDGDDPGHTWPFSKDAVARYPMFRNSSIPY